MPEQPKRALAQTTVCRGEKGRLWTKISVCPEYPHPLAIARDLDEVFGPDPPHIRLDKNSKNAGARRVGAGLTQ